MTEPKPAAAMFPPKMQHYEFNGVGSSNSSRGSSPLPKSDSIPSSQLPPTIRSNIPASQLPPARSAMSNLTQKVSQLNVSNQEPPSLINSVNKSKTFSQKLEQNEMENVPLNDHTSAELINKNVTVSSNSNNMNLLFNTSVLSDNQNNQIEQTPVNSLSQYFSQNSSRNSTPSSRSTTEEPAVTQQHSSSDAQPHKPSFTGFPPVHNFQPNAFDSLQNVPLHNRATTVEQPQPPPPPYSAYPPQINIKSNTNQAFGSLPQQQFTTKPAQPQYSPNPTQTRQPSHVKYPQMSQNYAQIHPQTTQPAAAFNTNPIRTAPTSFQQQQQQQQQQNMPVSSQSQQSNAFSNRNVTPPTNYAPMSLKQPQVGGVPPPPLINQASYGPPPVTTGQASFIPPLTNQANFPATSTNQSSYRVPLSNPPNVATSPTNQVPIRQPQPPQPQQQPLQSQFVNQTNFGIQASGTMQPSFTGPIQNQQSIQHNSTINRYPGLMQPLAATSAAPQPTGGIVQTGFNKFFGIHNHDLLQLPNILPPEKIDPPPFKLGNERFDQVNCSPEIFRSTMTKIPETPSLLQKSRLPLGLLVHPFKDLAYLPVIQCNVIVRCRGCRTYINPFVVFLDAKRWKCNLCYRPNELPEEFQYDPMSKTYGDPSRRPEVKSSTIEYIAPAEYMLRPPQPAVYLFLLDVSRFALDNGYLEVFCKVLLEELKKLPGDARTQVGFVAYNTSLHVFSLADGANQPHEMVILDVDDVFVPAPENLLVNLKNGIEMIVDLLKLLPQRFNKSFDANSALGAALQFAYKLLAQSGEHPWSRGRVTVFQAALPNIGPGAVTAREDPNQRAAVDVAHLNPANDFYKRLALEYSAQQIAVDLFIVNSQYVDLATISGISKFSGGCIYHFPLFKTANVYMVDSFQKSLRRYLSRKIGFEAVMRVRCSRGLAIHTFHGNFFVRSTDLLTLPNVNPDAGFGMQVAIEESLSGCQTVCFQAALLYTSSKGERRIRVHTLCLPVVATLDEVIYSADQQCIVGLLGKMAVDRSTQSSLTDAREAFINAAIDTLSAYKLLTNLGSNSPGLFAPDCLKLLPLYISAILKHPAFRIGIPTKLDDRVKAMIDMKTKPLPILMQQIYPDLYPIHHLESLQLIVNHDDEPIYLPPRLQLSSRCLDSKGAYLMDCGDHIIIFVCPSVSRDFLQQVLGVASYTTIPDNLWNIPTLDNQFNRGLHNFINYLCDEKSFYAPLQVLRDNSPNRIIFLEKLVDDRLDNSLSYHEFLQHIKAQVK